MAHNHDMKQGTIIFFHIPKTAGTSVSTILRNNFSKYQVYQLSGQNNYEDILRFTQLSEEQRQKIKLILGHNSHKLAKYVNKPIHYITFIRNPMEHTISSYFYIKQTPHNIFHEEVSRLEGFKQFIEWQVDRGVDNLQTRYLSGSTTYDAKNKIQLERQVVTAQHFNKAINFLENIELVLLTEDFHNAIKLIVKKFDLKHEATNVKLNVSEKQFSKEDLNEEEQALLEKIMYWDIKLYKVAKKIYNQVKDEIEYS